MGLKGTIAIAQEHAGVVGDSICGDDVKFTVAVHIAQGHRVWINSGGECDLGLKGAISIA